MAQKAPFRTNNILIELKGDILIMKYFRLVDTAYRKQVDLRLYEDDIASAVAKVKPNAQLFVEKDGFYTIPELGKRESIAVSQELRRNSGLDEYTMQRPCLFNSIPRIPINKKEDE